MTWKNWTTFSPLNCSSFVQLVEVGDSAIAVHDNSPVRVYKRSQAICVSSVATPPNRVSPRTSQ